MTISYCRDAWTRRHDSLGAIIITIHGGGILSHRLYLQKILSLSVLLINYMASWFSGVNKIVNGL